MGLKLIPKNWFYFITSLYVALGLYVLLIAYMTPYLGIGVKAVNGQWELNEIAYNQSSYTDWANKHGISKGDIVLSADNVSLHNISSIHYTKEISAASHLVIQKRNGQIVTIHIHPFDFPYSFYMLIILPSVYFLVALAVAFYLYYNKSYVPYLKFLILFILTVALAYASTGASSGTNTIGMMVNSGSMLLCLVILLHFLKNYFTFLKVKWIFIQNIKILYIIPLSAILLRFTKAFYPKLWLWTSALILILFLLLLFYILYTLLYSYFKYRLPQLKLFFISLGVPFLPFLILYVLPQVLFKQSIVKADISALFLLLIPFNIIFLQTTERLFDITYHISRFRYYSTLSLVFSAWLIIGIYLIQVMASTNLFLSALFIFASSLIFLYIKEKTDYRGRKILFSIKGNQIHRLYLTIEKIGHSHGVEQMLQILTKEIITYLEVKEVAVVTYSYETKTLVSTNNHVPLPNIESIPSLNPTEIIKKGNQYIALIHEDKDYKRWLILNRHTIRLKEEELLWLELLLTYTHSFIESTKVIEELVEELNQLQKTDLREPTWLQKLIWIKLEEEKFQLAQELHDTFLQEHIHIARQTDGLIYEQDLLAIKSKLKNLHEQLILSIHDLRAYCETLKPPLLANVGLHAALERLFEYTKNRANFKLIAKLDRLYLEDEQLTLVIYRIVQELLNNALKHSQSEIVEIYLQELDTGFELIYHDDGIGFNVSDIQHSESMGLQGIRERVEAFNGQMIIDSEVNEGVSIQIKIIERSEVLDFRINN